MRARKPPRSREQYILDSIPEIFKGGEWVEPAVENTSSSSRNESSSMGGEGVSGRGNGNASVPAQDSTSTRYMTIIGGQKYDERELLTHIFDHPNIVVGAGRGVESDIAKSGPECGVTVIPVDPDRFGKNARKCNVEQVLCFAPDSPLLLVGSGERVKQAKSWLERTLSKREVIELP